MSIRKKCVNHASEESYEIYSGSTRLLFSSLFSNYEDRTDTYCLEPSSNSLYTLKLKDSYGDSWTAGSWISVAGPYGNVVLKTMMIEQRDESFNLSFSYPIPMNSDWKGLSSATTIVDGWNTLAFSDDWETVTLGTGAHSATGTQYFRKAFTGLINMAAYEIRFYYRYGIIAYVNGKEIFRDNMEDGAVTPSTPSTGAYDSNTYHGIIIPASTISSNSPNLLAVELHFSSLNETSVEFNAFVASIASSISNDNTHLCYVYPYGITFDAAGYSSSNLFDYKRTSYYSVSSLPTVVTFSFTGPRPNINGIRVFTASSYTSSPTTFQWQGSRNGSVWNSVISVSKATYPANSNKIFNGYFSTVPYSSYRLTVTEGSAGSALELYEFHPMTCNVQTPTAIQFSPTSYSFYAVYDQVHIAPVLKEITGCSITPSLPAGLALDALTCTVTGVLQTALPNTTFVMTTTMEGLTLEGSFSLKGVSCEGTLTMVTRTYSYNAFQESFSIKDMTTQQEVLSVAAGSGQASSTTWSTIICLTGSLYEIDVGSTSAFWQGNSFLYVYAILDGDQVDTVARIRYDSNLGLPEDRIVNLKWSISPKTSWFYKMGVLPANWHNAETAGWESSSFGAFPASSNQIQLYKKSFNVESLEGVAGFVISLRYIYGCVIYMNGVEVFRNSVDGELSMTSYGLNNYNDILYHQISLPVRPIASAGGVAVDYLRTGSNTVAVAIVAQSATYVNSVFDCTVRLMSGPTSSRVFSYSISSNNIMGSPGYVAEHYYGYSMNAVFCGLNYWMITFQNDRREWISSMTLYLYYSQDKQQPKQFVLKARNKNLEEWTTLKTVTNMSWSLKGEHKKMWVENSKPYNQYRFENIGTGDAENCDWRLGAIDLSADAIGVVPDLAYTTPIVIIAGVEMGEVYPNSEFYYDFTVTPALPEGLSIDANTGKISGRVGSLLPSSTYSIQAKKVNGGTSTAVVALSVEACTGNKSLITLVALTDAWPWEGSYKLYKGKGTSGEVVSSISAFKLGNGLNYGDFCVDHHLYTLELLDSRRDGWKNPGGWWLTVDLGELVFEMSQMPDRVVSVSTMFSSLLPFQVEYDEWKLFNSESEVSGGWKDVDFDDAQWSAVKAAAMGNHIGTTAYVRHEVTIPSLEDYHVLNVRVKYTGGVVAYFNGRIVARFNLDAAFDRSTEAITAHESSFSKFHVVFPTVGAVAGKNVMAFEIHRASGQSAIVFDATGVFGVNDCSVVVDTFSAISASEVKGCSKEDLLELKTVPYGNLLNEVGAFLEWTVENLEGSRWNSFGIHTNGIALRFGFSLYGRTSNEVSLPVLEVTNASMKEKERSAWDVPVAVMGFPSFRFEVDAVASADVSVNAYMMLYCKPATAGSCPAIDDFPAVGEGQISPATCPEGFQGYAYRECANGVLGEVKNDKCQYLLPEAIQYENNNMEFVLDTEVSSGKPTYKNIITEFYMQDSTPLPDGLSIDAKTGEISGIPTRRMEQRMYTVRGKNPQGETIVKIHISVRKGYCVPEGVFERTPVGEVAVYDCAMQGNYVGSQKRACVLGKKDGEWKKATGNCLPIMGIVIAVFVVMIVLVAVMFILLRTRKSKSTGGGKGATAVKARTKKVTKAVKV